MWEVLLTHKELERKLGQHDVQICSIFEAIRQLMIPPEKPKGKIGFHADEAASRADQEIH